MESVDTGIRRREEEKRESANIDKVVSVSDQESTAPLSREKALDHFYLHGPTEPALI